MYGQLWRIRRRATFLARRNDRRIVAVNLHTKFVEDVLDRIPDGDPSPTSKQKGDGKSVHVDDQRTGISAVGEQADVAGNFNLPHKKYQTWRIGNDCKSVEAGDGSRGVHSRSPQLLDLQPQIWPVVDRGSRGTVRIARGRG